MIKFIVAINILFLLVACSVQEALASKVGMRCSGALINVGDDMLKVITNCGLPHLEVDRKGKPIKYLYTKNGMTYTIIFRGTNVLHISRSR